MWEGHKRLHLLKARWKLMVAGREGVIFFSGVVTEKTPWLQEKVPPTFMHRTLRKLSGSSTKARKRSTW